mmetsp:Transcript_15421/g.47729  ORF Transcript_15421/g.47729 Transcript_15421/m.47729 type:complete len:293 (+) Transcript_15421:655-1533(+)
MVDGAPAASSVKVVAPSNGLPTVTSIVISFAAPAYIDVGTSVNPAAMRRRAKTHGVVANSAYTPAAPPVTPMVTFSRMGASTLNVNPRDSVPESTRRNEGDTAMALGAVVPSWRGVSESVSPEYTSGMETVKARVDAVDGPSNASAGTSVTTGAMASTKARCSDAFATVRPADTGASARTVIAPAALGVSVTVAQLCDGDSSTEAARVLETPLRVSVTVALAARAPARDTDTFSVMAPTGATSLVEPTRAIVRKAGSTTGMLTESNPTHHSPALFVSKNDAPICSVVPAGAA